ncbi:hypothetical protein GCM10010215_43010 [Streptomyces virginiae]|uniref:Integral membrane protein n=1 Tax=Streptomyces virginiae TaxID=1961 RepID=A0ABQ3NYB0_STRVG|nr:MULTISPECIES: hypothetical protein [Streptomyces]MBP2348591.1 hypothetical protein [Streptomyces virginiae]GGQ13501.1 hypothetical protein GCM10010215_43010 [Streptomyces virginiae]GHI17767.1 hypothetical protein Scinn_72300 [Streptomyces virginiae]
MNDPITLAATQHEDRHGNPDTTVPDTRATTTAGPDTPDTPDTPDGQDAPDDSDAQTTQRMRTLLETAATCRPVEEVTALVSLLKEDGPLPDAGHDALRAAAVTRPVQDVQRMVTLLGEAPHEVGEADLTLRAAAVGRSIEDVALLVNILGKEAAGEPEQQPRSGPAAAARAAGPAGPAAAPSPGRAEEPYAVPYPALYEAPHAVRSRRPAPAPAGDAARTPALRHVLRWPVAIALLVSGALHLPQDLMALPSASPLGLLPLLVTVVCLGIGALVALRDTTAVWRAGAATALGVVALHVIGGSLAFDPLAGTVGASQAWAGAAVMLSAAAGAVLAGLALRNRQETSA